MGDVYTNPPQSRNEAILRATIDGTEYTAPPQSRIEDLLLELKEAIEQGGTGEGDMKKSVYDSDNSVATAGGIKMFVNQKIGTLPQRVGSLETTAGVLEGEVASIEDTLDNLGTASTKNSTSVVTESSDLVESGAVYDALGFGNKNKFNYNAWKGISITKGTGVFENNGVTLTATENDAYTAFSLPNYPENAKIPVKEGENIKLTWDCDETVQLGYVFIFPNGTVTGAVNTDNSTKQLEYTPTTGVTFITFRVGVYTSGNTIHYKDIMISKDGGVYEPYHASVDETKADNSVIGTVESGANPTKAYKVGEHMTRGRKLCTVTSPVATSSTWTLGSNYVEGDVASVLDYKVDGNTIFSTGSGSTVFNFPYKRLLQVHSSCLIILSGGLYHVFINSNNTVTVTKILDTNEARDASGSYDNDTLTITFTVAVYGAISLVCNNIVN